MIEKVEIFAMPTWSQQVIVATSGANQLPWCIFDEDNDDANTTSVNALQQCPGARYTQFCGNGLNVKPLCVIHPKPAEAMYRSSTGFAYGESKGPRWVDMAYTTTPHYGLKMALDNAYSGYAANATVGALNIVAKIHYAFKEQI